MAKITYTNKVKIKDIPVAEVNKFTADNANEIKTIVNGLDDIKENIANKSQTVETDKLSVTKYPSVKALYDWAIGKFQLALGFTPANDANVIHKTGNEVKNGSLSIFDTGDGYGVEGNSIDGTGVYGESENGIGLQGNSIGGIGVFGSSIDGIGVYGYSELGTGLNGYSDTGTGLSAYSENGIGLQINGNGTVAIDCNLGNTNKGLVLDSGASSTGNPIEVIKDGVTKFVVNQEGQITATAGTTAEQVVIKSQLDAKQDTLVSASNIKTINGNSLLGSGDIIISGGGGGGGDMVLADAQTVSGLKTFLNAAFGLRNVANTFTSFFSNANTASRTYTLQDKSYTLADIAITVRKISTATTLAESDNGTVILLTGSCTVTLPNGLSLGFNCSFVTATGATMTYALGGSIVLINNAFTTMGEKSSHTITNTGVLNEYITVGL